MGVGSLGLTQYVAAIIPAVIALMLQDRIAALILGEAAASAAPAASGLTPSLLVAFAVQLSAPAPSG